jgi:CBS domain-containing protein
VAPDAPAREVADVLINERIHRVPVRRGADVVGIISTHDLLDLIS